VPKRRSKRQREPAATVDYTDPEGNVLTLREQLSDRTVRKVGPPPTGSGDAVEDAWHRRTEMLFEYLVVRWEIAGLPLDDQKMLLGRYRMADADTQRWVRRAIAQHLDSYIPQLAEPRL
jgi:hypothetical protein